MHAHEDVFFPFMNVTCMGTWATQLYNNNLLYLSIPTYSKFNHLTPFPSLYIHMHMKRQMLCAF